MTDKSEAMMDGSYSSSSYLKVGQHGDFGLGIRLYPLNLVGPAAMCPEGYVYLAVRVRVAHASTMHTDKDSSVINLGDKKLSIADVFNDITWEKENKTRKSGFYGMYVKADINKDPVDFMKVLYGGPMRVFCQGIVSLVGGHAVIEASTVMAYISGPLIKAMKPVIKAKKLSDELKKKLEGGPSSSGFHVAEFMKKLQPKDEQEKPDVSPVVQALSSVDHEDDLLGGDKSSPDKDTEETL